MKFAKNSVFYVLISLLVSTYGYTSFYDDQAASAFSAPIRYTINQKQFDDLSGDLSKKITPIGKALSISKSLSHFLGEGLFDVDRISELLSSPKNYSVKKILKKLNVFVENPVADELAVEEIISAAEGLTFSEELAPTPETKQKKQRKHKQPAEEARASSTIDEPAAKEESVVTQPAAQSAAKPKNVKKDIATDAHPSVAALGYAIRNAPALAERCRYTDAQASLNNMAAQEIQTRASARVPADAWVDQPGIRSATKSGNESLTVSQKKELLTLKAQAAQGALRTSDFDPEGNWDVYILINTLGNQGLKNNDIVAALLEAGHRPKPKK